MEGWRKAPAPWGTWSCGVTEEYGLWMCVCVHLKSCWLAFGIVLWVCYVQGTVWKITFTYWKEHNPFSRFLSAWISFLLHKKIGVQIKDDKTNGYSKVLHSPCFQTILQTIRHFTSNNIRPTVAPYYSLLFSLAMMYIGLLPMTIGQQWSKVIGANIPLFFAFSLWPEATRLEKYKTGKEKQPNVINSVNKIDKGHTAVDSWPANAMDLDYDLHVNQPANVCFSLFSLLISKDHQTQIRVSWFQELDALLSSRQADNHAGFL